MSKEAIKQMVAAYFAAIRAMDADAWVATFAEDAISHDPVGSPPMRGHAELRRFFEGIASAFNKVGLTENHVFVCGDGAAVKWTGRGVGKNGREVTFEGIDVFQVNVQGKIQTVWAYWDLAALMTQLQG